MTRANSSAGVAVKIFVERHVIAPMRIGLKFLGLAEHRPPSVAVAQEDPRKPARKLRRYFPEVLPLPGSRRKFRIESVAQKMVKLLKRFDQKKIHRKPDRPAPIRISAEESRRRFPRLVIHTMRHPIGLEHKRFV